MAEKRTVYYHGDKHQTGYDIIGGRHSQRLDADAPIPEGWSEADTAPVPEPEVAAETSPPDLDAMSRDELADYAKTAGVSLDRRKSKANMLWDFKRARR